MKYIILIFYGLLTGLLLFLEKYAGIAAMRDCLIALFIFLIIFDEKENK